MIVDAFSSLTDYQFVVYVENLDKARCDQQRDRPVYWHQDILGMASDHFLTCSLATTQRRGWIEASSEFQFATLIHPSSEVSRKTRLGEGVIVEPLCVVAGFSKIGAHTRIGRRASIGHHTAIGRFCTIHPGSLISGRCSIADGVTVCTGAVIIDGIEIGENAVVGAGAIVTKDVEAGSLVVGNPAKTIKINYGPI